MSERNTDLLLQDIREAIENIFNFTAQVTFEEYSSDIKTRHAVEHNFMIIGEAVARMPDDYKLEHPHINWRQIKDFRNIVVHDYFGIDNSIVWRIIKTSLPQLSGDIALLIETKNNSN